MRRFSFGFTTVMMIGVLAIFSSCNRVPAHLATIPQEAGFCVAIDLKNIGLKGQFDDLQQFKIFSHLQGDFEKNNKVLSDKLMELNKNPFALGIDPLESIYCFAANAPNGERFIGFTIKLSDQKNFNELVEAVLASSGKSTKINAEGAFKSVEFPDSPVVMGWDNQKCVIMIPGDGASDEGLMAYLTDVIEKGASRSLTTDPAFREFIGSTKDISWWVDLKLFEESREYQAAAGTIGLTSMAGSIYSGHLEFEEGKVVASSELLYNEEIKKLMADRGFVKNEIDTELLKALPGDTIMGALGFGYHPEDFVKSLEETMKSTPQMEMLNKSIGVNFGLDFVDLNAAMGGDMVILLSSLPETTRNAIQNGTSPLPGITMAMTLDNKEMYGQLMALIPKGMAEEKGDYLQINIGNYPIYTGLFERNWVITTNSKDITNFGSSSGSRKSLLDTKIGENMQDNGLYGYWNMNPKVYPAGLLARSIGREEGYLVDMFVQNWTLFNHLEVVGEDATHFEVTLYLNDDSENSLFLILQQFDEQVSEVVI